MMLQYSALAIFLLGAAGLADHSMLLKTGHIRPGFFCFYTNLSNIWILLYQILLFFAGFSPEGALWRVLTDVRVSTGMTLSIWVTHLMYHFVLVPDAKKRGKRFSDFGASFGNLCAHYITPALVLAQWLSCRIRRASTCGAQCAGSCCRFYTASSRSCAPGRESPSATRSCCTPTPSWTRRSWG